MSRRRPTLYTTVNGVARVPWAAQTAEQRRFVFDHSAYLWPEAPDAMAARRERDVRGEAASRFRQQFVDCLPGLPEPANRGTDMAIGYYDEDGDIVGVAGFTHLAKRSKLAQRKYFGRIVRHYRAPGGTIADLELDLLSEQPADIRKACRWALVKQKVDQMLGHGPGAGHVLKSDVNGTVVTVRMMVDEPVAARKVDYDVYTGAVAEFDGWFTRISLVDNDELAKGGAAEALCKLYEAGTVDRKAWKEAKRLTKVNGQTRLDNYRMIRAGTDVDWRIAKQMSRSSGRPRAECYRYAAAKRTAMQPALPPPTPAQNELAHVGDLIRNGTIKGQLASELAKRAADALRIEEIKSRRAFRLL